MTTLASSSASPTSIPPIPPFDQFKPLVWRMSKYCWDRLPFPRPMSLNDLFNEGWLAYQKAANKYDSSRGTKFITYFWWVLSRHYASILNKAMKHHSCPSSASFVDESGKEAGLEQIADPNPPQPRFPLAEMFLHRLSREALLVVRAFLQGGEFDEWESLHYARSSSGPTRLRRVMKFLKVANPKAIMNEIAAGLLGSEAVS